MRCSPGAQTTFEPAHPNAPKSSKYCCRERCLWLSTPAMLVKANSYSARKAVGFCAFVAPVLCGLPRLYASARQSAIFAFCSSPPKERHLWKAPARQIEDEIRMRQSALCPASVLSDDALARLGRDFPKWSSRRGFCAFARYPSLAIRLWPVAENRPTAKSAFPTPR